MTTIDTPTYRKEIVYDRETRDYEASYDGQLIGYYDNHLAAEVALDDYALHLIESGLDRTATELDGGADQPAPYKLIDGAIGQWSGGMYRFYCYPSSWAISPAARAGHTYEGADAVHARPAEPAAGMLYFCPCLPVVPSPSSASSTAPTCSDPSCGRQAGCRFCGQPTTRPGGWCGCDLTPIVSPDDVATTATPEPLPVEPHDPGAALTAAPHGTCSAHGCTGPATMPSLVEGLWMCAPCAIAGEARMRRAIFWQGPRCTECGEPLEQDGYCAECLPRAQGEKYAAKLHDEPEQFFAEMDELTGLEIGEVMVCLAAFLDESVENVSAFLTACRACLDRGLGQWLWMLYCGPRDRLVALLHGADDARRRAMAVSMDTYLTKRFGRSGGVAAIERDFNFLIKRKAADAS